MSGQARYGEVYVRCLRDERDDALAEVARLRGRADYAEKVIYRLVSTTDLRKAPKYLKRAMGDIVRKHDDDPLDASSDPSPAPAEETREQQ